MKRKLDLLIPFICLLALASACRKDTVRPEESVETTTGVLILNQGQFNQSNASISYYDYITGSFTLDAYSARNENTEGLGDVANDWGIYGSKLYVVVNNSNKVEVMDAQTLTYITKVDIDQPRNIAFTEGKIWVSSWGGHVFAMDTANLTAQSHLDSSLIVKDSVQVGRNPEMLLALNNRIYVANSGALSEQFDRTISVINLQNMVVESTIDVADNLTHLFPGTGDVIYAATSDVYDGAYENVIHPARLYEVNTISGSISRTFDFDGNYFTTFNDEAYFVSKYRVAGQQTIIKLDMQTQQILSEEAVPEEIENFYGIDINPINGDYYFAGYPSASVGIVYVYDQYLQPRQTLSVAPFPSKFIFRSATVWQPVQ